MDRLENRRELEKIDVVDALKTKALRGKGVTYEETMELWNAPLEKLRSGADEIRRVRCGNDFSLCSIINAKSGSCSEDCKFCAQSAHYSCRTEEYPVLSIDKIVKEALYNFGKGVNRFSLVTSGRSLDAEETEKICLAIKSIKKEVNMEVCLSLGLLTEEQLRKLKDAGAARIHCNMETSRRHFSNICTTHTYDEKISCLKLARRMGFDICCGGIMGIGETRSDRVDMALIIRALGIKSVPVNFLNPVPGTPLENQEPVPEDERNRILAVYRFIIPDGDIRMAGGRGLYDDMGERGFVSGANAAITGDMLTTAGISIESDKRILKRLGYVPK